MNNPLIPPAGGDGVPHGADPADFNAWLQRQAARDNSRCAPSKEPVEFSDLMKALDALPRETPEEKAEREQRRIESARHERLAAFRRICPPEFAGRIDRGLLTNPSAFDAVGLWQGTHPSPLLCGATGTAKTRAAWSVLGRLITDEGKSLAWFPVKRLLTEFSRYESKELADEFWRYYRGYNLLFVDDIDKINWQFESESSALFQFYDWIYREKRPCLTTTNKGREWWADKMGDAFARRLFDDAHTPIQF